MKVLYIDIDSLRRDHLGCYGYERSDHAESRPSCARRGAFHQHVRGRYAVRALRARAYSPVAGASRPACSPTASERNPLATTGGPKVNWIRSPGNKTLATRDRRIPRLAAACRRCRNSLQSNWPSPVSILPQSLPLPIKRPGFAPAGKRTTDRSGIVPTVTCMRRRSRRMR